MKGGDQVVEGLAVGRIVHFVDNVGDHRASIITGIVDPGVGGVDLYVFPMTDNRGGFVIPNVWFDPREKAGSWHWPERG